MVQACLPACLPTPPSGQRGHQQKAQTADKAYDPDQTAQRRLIHEIQCTVDNPAGNKKQAQQIGKAASGSRYLYYRGCTNFCVTG